MESILLQIYKPAFYIGVSCLGIYLLMKLVYDFKSFSLSLLLGVNDTKNEILSIIGIIGVIALALYLVLTLMIPKE